MVNIVNDKSWGLSNFSGTRYSTNTPPSQFVYSPAYPRLASYDIGGHNYDSSAVRAYLANKHIVINNYWDGWQSGRTLTMPATHDAIRAASTLPGGQKFLLYMNPITVGAGADGNSGDQRIRQDAYSGNWFLRDDYPSGSYISHYYNSGYKVLNPLAGMTQVNGRTLQQLVGLWSKDIMFDGGTGGFALQANAANPLLDGGFQDDLFERLPIAGDWNRDHINETNLLDPSSVALFRAGLKAFYDDFTSRNPTKLQFANLSNGYNSERRNNLSNFVNALFHGGLCEHHLGAASYCTERSQGYSTSAERLASFAEMIAKYQWAEDICREPKSVIVSHNGVTTQGRDGNDATNNYRAQRYGLAFTLIFGNGYYYPNSSDSSNYAPDSNRLLPELDEYKGGVSGGIITPTYGWMGAAIEARQTTAMSSSMTNGATGLYSRRFSNAVVVINPWGNGTQTLYPTYMGKAVSYRLNGSQDATLNSGAAINSGTSIVIPERSAIFFHAG